ncbi:LysR family transcriptional regulator [Enterococcus gilvus]|uniref:LysR family transcriptional regulator n=1 Tax=Enterococcus gilvus TaxID=160453 RepID=UPI0028D5D68C|nr:LysR family transcriptional regulator [Enterococcus gilvus]
MSIEKLEYFYVIAKYNSLSKASQELFIGISSLSSALKSLESELGYDLFTRHGKKLSLSEEGEKILPVVKRILEEAKKIHFPLYPMIDCPTFKVGVSESVFLFEAGEYPCRNETYTITYTHAAPLTLLNQLKQKEVDLVITDSLVDDPQLERTPLIRSKILLAANFSMLPTLSQATLKLLAHLPFIVLSDHLGHQQLTQRMTDYFQIAPEYLFCQDSLGIHKWLHMKKGVCVIHAIEKEWLANEWIRFFSLPPALSLDYYLYKNKSNSELFGIEEVEAHLKQLFREIARKENDSLENVSFHED